MHFTPQEWLHITTFVVGPLDKVATADVQGMIETAARLLRVIPPVSITIERVLYHPEAIALAVDPRHALDAVKEAVQIASRNVAASDEGGIHQPWMPHVTVAYSTTPQEAAPIIESLGKQIPGRDITINSISLVIQKGPERIWDWHPIAKFQLGSPISKASN
jgi:2'-5' RNA ligase